MSLFRLKSTFRYYLEARSNLYIHSPWVYDFYNTVLKGRSREPALDGLRKLRKRLSRDQTIQPQIDLGSQGEVRQRKTSQINRSMSVTPKYGRLLHRICRRYQPQRILELGTGIGISAAYMHLGAPDAKILTLEGAERFAVLARQHWSELGLRSVTCRTGAFTEQLPGALASLGAIDLAYIDGHHQPEAMETNLERIMPAMAAESLLLLDDIRWSPEMLAFWQQLRMHARVALSIDLGRMGLLVLTPTMRVQQHFALYF